MNKQKLTMRNFLCIYDPVPDNSNNNISAKCNKFYNGFTMTERQAYTIIFHCREIIVLTLMNRYQCQKTEYLKFLSFVMKR